MPTIDKQKSTNRSNEKHITNPFYLFNGENTMTKFIKSIERDDGYNGHKTIIYLCQELTSDQIWAVWTSGWFRQHNSNAYPIKLYR